MLEKFAYDAACQCWSCHESYAYTRGSILCGKALASGQRLYSIKGGKAQL
jgi:hypothetical protein